MGNNKFVIEELTKPEQLNIVDYLICETLNKNKKAKYLTLQLSRVLLETLGEFVRKECNKLFEEEFDIKFEDD